MCRVTWKWNWANTIKIRLRWKWDTFRSYLKNAIAIAKKHRDVLRSQWTFIRVLLCDLLGILLEKNEMNYQLSTSLGDDLLRVCHGNHSISEHQTL